MNLHKFLLFLLAFNLSLPGLAVNLPEYLNSRYKIRSVAQLPAQTEHKVLIISNRHFKPEDNFALKRGIHPWNISFLFVAGTVGDSAFIMPLAGLDESVREMAPYPDFLVYVDGHGKTFDQVVERGIELTGRFAVNLIVFDLPTDYLALRKTARNAGEVSANFVIAMRQFNTWNRQYDPSGTVSVFFHSMGNQILSNTTYVDFSLMASNEHNLFLGRSAAEKSNPLIFGFYEQVLHGKAANFKDETAYQILSPSEISFRFSLK